MKDPVLFYAEKLDFPDDAVETLCAAGAALSTAGAPVAALWKQAGDALFEGSGDLWLTPLAQMAGQVPQVPRETADMVFLLAALPRLSDRYRAAGLPERLFWDAVADLRFKLLECRRVRGVWGTFVTDWFAGFYRLTRFALGRLQFERRAFPLPSYGPLREGDTVVACHIPSSGPLRPDDVTDAFRRARDFFPDVRVDGAFPLFCSSWLLYPPVSALFPAGSNLAKFAARFEIAAAVPTPENPDVWRVFDRPYDPAAVADLPDATMLQAALKAFLLAGNCMGSGKGVIFLRDDA